MQVHIDVNSRSTQCNVHGDVSNNNGQNDAWILKIDNKGNLQWQKTNGSYKYLIYYNAFRFNVIVINDR